MVLVCWARLSALSKVLLFLSKLRLFDLSSQTIRHLASPGLDRGMGILLPLNSPCQATFEPACVGAPKHPRYETARQG